MRPSVLLALVLGAAPVLAQDLGQAAAREREKREKQAGTGKASPARVFTNDDLPKADESKAAAQPASTGLSSRALAEAEERGVAPADEGSPPSAPPGEGSPSPVDAEQEESEEQSWRSQATEARKPLREAEQKLKDVDERISSIRQQMSPFNPNRENDTNKILAFQEELRSLEGERESARQGLVEAKKAWEEFTDSARRSGVPVQWLEDAPR